ncbi:hypothetical protein MSPP1_001984 [Malassezia sp. CBS 17886]|nr:hypothetical protein MSPP1_001984 [Malassezia sp. CBS 17886]
MPNAPNTAVYVKNIDSKVKKPELRRQLYNLFGSYGKVLDVIATRADGMRGQAFVVFRDLQGATAAFRGLDGFEFYAKPLSLDYARNKSHATIVQEHGEEALVNMSNMKKLADGSSAPGKVTYSNAQGAGRAQEKKRTREEVAAAARGAAAANGAESADARPLKTARTEGEEEEEEEEDDDAMEMGDSDDE